MAVTSTFSIPAPWSGMWFKGGEVIHKRDVSAKTLAGHFSAAGKDDDGKEPASKVGVLREFWLARNRKSASRANQMRHEFV